MGLHESFANVHGQILLDDVLPTINKVFSLVIQEERQRELCASSSLTHDSVAMLSKADSSASLILSRLIFVKKGRFVRTVVF
jgi:hypothetical protein